MKVAGDSSNYNFSQSNNPPVILFVVSPSEDRSQVQYRNYEISSAKRIGENFLKAAFETMPHYECVVCDSNDDMEKAIAGFSEQVTRHQRPFIVFTGHGTNEGNLHFIQGPDVHARDMLLITDRLFREKRLINKRKWPVRCIFTQCYNHLVAQSDEEDRPWISQYSDDVEFVYFTTANAPLVASKLQLSTFRSE